MISAGVKGSLDRLQLEYVDIVFATRPDTEHETSLETIVRLDNTKFLYLKFR